MISPSATLLPRRLSLGIAACLVMLLPGALIAQDAQAPVQPAAPPAAAAPAPAPNAPAAETAAQPPAPAPPAAPALPPDVTDKIQNVVGTMEGAEKSLTDITTLDQNIGRLRDRVENVIATTTQVADNLRPRLADINSQILQLGPPPEKGQPPEAAAVAADRARLTAEASEISGAIKTLELTWVRARQAIDKITDLRLQIFTRSLMERMTSPLFPSLWTDLIDETPPVQRLVTYIVDDWFGAVGRQVSNVLILSLLSVLLYAALKVLARRLTRKPVYPGARVPSFFERAATASWSAPVRAIPAAATGFFVYAGLDYLGLLYYPSARIAAAILRGTLIYVSVAHLISAVLTPGDRQLRLVELSDATALRLCRLLKALAAIYAIDLCVTALGRILYFPLSMSVVQSLVASIAFAGVLVGIVLTRFEPLTAANGYPMPRDRPRWLKVPLWLAAAAIIIASLSGYVALGRFAAQQIVMTFVVGLVATLLFLAIRAFTRDPGENGHAVGQMLEERFGIDAPRRRQLAWLTEAALTLTLAIIALPILLLQWGFSGADIRDWLKSALFGFEIGQFRISLVRILIGIVLFTALLFVTRVVQRHLRDNVLRRPAMDPGIANSVDTAVGYAGTALAAMLAISYAGLDITNFAIVAGALSVGIGFGLQSIVNNFVSGLILLIERPIKVGDWVVVGGEQGNVRRISVRSTEIETFDRASLIVPNSELISSRVLNWTHRNALGRLIIKISAGPDANPRKVTEILLECASASIDVLAEPPPLAIFEGFTPASTDFTLRVLLPDISKGLKVQSDLRIAIFEALRSANIPLAPAPPLPAPVTIMAAPPQPPASPPAPFVPRAAQKEQT